jgi:hypothetical protein
VGHVIPVDTVKAIRAAVTSRWIADLRGASPKLGCGPVIPDDDAVPVAKINADREKIQQPIGDIEDALVQQILE